MTQNIPGSNQPQNSRSPVRDALLVLLPAILLALLAYSALSGGPAAPSRPGEDAPDMTPPELFLTRDKDYFVYPGESYEEEGYAAYDDRDGDLTKKVEVSVNGDLIRYRVRDAAGNTCIRFRRIPYADSTEEAQE